MGKLTVLSLLWLFAVGIAMATTPFTEGYAEAVSSQLLGLSSSSSYKVGLRDKQVDGYLFAHNEWADTNGTNLPYQYRLQGTSLGVGARYWFPGRKLSGTVSFGRGIAGDNKDRDDFRAGLAGYDAWEHERRYTDLYGEAFWIQRADDLFLSVRYRPGVTLHKTDTARLWTYGIGQVWASGQGENGTENRLETGAGLGYIFLNGHATANIELRGGYSYRGNIGDRAYWNPTFVLAGSF